MKRNTVYMKLFYVPVTSVSISHSAIYDQIQTTLKYNFEDFIRNQNFPHITEHSTKDRAYWLGIGS
jgi:hypothetical protein